MEEWTEEPDWMDVDHLKDGGMDGILKDSNGMEWNGQHGFIFSLKE